MKREKLLSQFRFTFTLKLHHLMSESGLAKRASEKGFFSAISREDESLLKTIKVFLSSLVCRECENDVKII